MNYCYNYYLKAIHYYLNQLLLYYNDPDHQLDFVTINCFYFILFFYWRYLSAIVCLGLSNWVGCNQVNWLGVGWTMNLHLHLNEFEPIACY